MPAHGRARPVLVAVTGLALIASSVVVSAQTPPAPSPLTFDAAVERALAANPTVAAAQLRRAIDLAAIGVAGQHPNPDVHTEFSKETPKQSLGLAIPLELGGKRDRRIAVAKATAQVGEAEIAQTIIDIRAQVRHAYFARVIADARLAVLNAMQQLATQVRDAAQARFDVGSAPRLEVVYAQLALAEAENQATAAQTTVQSATVELNALLGFPLDAPLTLSSTLEAAPPLSAAASLERAQASNTELIVLDRQIAEQNAKLGLAHTLNTPDITPDVTLTHAAEPEFTYGWRFAATATVPLFNTHSADVQVEQATLAQLQAQRMAVLARVTGEVTSASAIANAQRAAYLRYQNDILPQTRQVEQMAQDWSRLGQTGIAALVQALQASRDIQLRSLQAASDLQDALASLERAIGAPIP